MKQTSYKDAGVDIDAGNKLVDLIKPLAKSTARTGADAKLGGFGALFDIKATNYSDPVLVSATDGVGTKLKIAFDVDKHDTIGIDLVAMCVNDLVVQGAEPLFFLDYFATGGLDNNVAVEVVKGIAEGCKKSNSALIGGETAEMPGMYAKGHYDLAGFSVGAVEREQILPKDVSEGDVVIGLASSGVHSNGFSLVRHILSNNNIEFNDEAPFSNGKSFGEVLLEPTKIYVKSCLEAIRGGGVKALSHITGGGFTENIPRVLSDGLAVEIDLNSFDKLDIFKWIAEYGNVAQEEMLKTFNCGIGMVLIVDASKVDSVIDSLKKNDEKAFVIGRVKSKIKDSVEYLNSL